MAISASLSLLGLYNYDPTIFDDLQIPAALDKSTLVDNILMESTALEVLYPDPDFLKAAIGVWSAKMVGVWTQLWDTTQYEYNPIDNYDRHEEYTDSETRSGSDNTETESSSTGTGSSSGERTSTSAATAYNSDSFKDTGRSVTAGSDQTSSSSTGTGSADRTYSETVTRNHTAHLHGNIGVTTTMQMIKEQRDVVLYNLYDVIAADFIDRFCIGVY